MIKEKSLNKVWLGVSAILMCVILLIYAGSGASPLAAVYVWLGAFAGIYLPGWLIKDVAFKDKTDGVEFTVISVTGFAFFAAITLIAASTGFHFIVPVIVIILDAVFVARIRKRKTDIKQMLKSNTDYLSLIVLIVFVITVFNALWAVRYAHPLKVGQLRPSQDFFWNLGNVKSILIKFPVSDLRVSDVTLSYHFLTELLQAGLCMLTGVSAYDVTGFYSYLPVAAALTGCLFELGNQLWHNKAKGAFLAAMPLWIGCASLHKVMENGISRFGNNIMIHTVSNINGQATAFFALTAFLSLFVRYFDNCCENNKAGLGACIAAFYLLVFSKSPQGAIISIAFILAVAVYIAVAKLKKRKVEFSASKIVFAVCITVGFLLLYKLYFSAGANSSMSFSLTATIKSFYFANILNLITVKLPSLWQVSLPVLYAAQSFFMAPAIIAVWACTAIYDLFHLAKTGRFKLMLHAVIVGGFTAFYIFEHYSSSQIYFANIALFCAGIVFVDSAVKIWNSKGEIRAEKLVKMLFATGALVLAVGIATNGCFAAYLAYSSKDYLTGKGTSEYHISVTSAEEQACNWLSQQMTEDMYFATNRMHTGYSQEGLSNIYSGFLGRQAYCESFKYAVSNMGDHGGIVYEKYYQMCNLFDETKTQDEINQLCRQCNVHYIIFNPLSPGSDKALDFMTVVFEQDGIKIYKTDI